MTTLNVTAVITEFLADQSRTTLQLPSMAAEQRKQAKSLVDQYQELSCESYGFGADRQLHLFKASGCHEVSKETCVSAEAPGLPMHAVQVRNTFIDGWAPAGDKPTIFRSLQAPLKKGELYQHGTIIKNNHRDSSPDCSTSASGEEIPESSRTCSTYVESSLHISPDLEGSLGSDMPFEQIAQVRNTFIHLEKMPIDERIVQSMPHGMFGQSLLASQAAEFEEAPIKHSEMQSARCVPFSPGSWQKGMEFGAGTLVVIQDLQKAPAFNGLIAVVQGWDEVSERYSIVIASGASNQQAKVKVENLRLLASCP